jgi:hypothetical protein
MDGSGEPEARRPSVSSKRITSAARPQRLYHHWLMNKNDKRDAIGS